MEKNKLKWTAMWGNAISFAERKVDNYAKDVTLRYPIHTMFDGTSLRITLSNYCGSEPITISKVYIANLAGTKAIHRSTQKSVTFNSNESITIEPGCEVISDIIEYNVKAGVDICVSFYLKDYTQMRSGVLVTGPYSKGYFATGDYVCSAEMPQDYSRSTSWFYFLSTIDVLTKPKNHTIICYGDSITAQDWPDYLNMYIDEQHITDIAVIRRAVCGTRVLREYNCITYESYGMMGSKRFEHETATCGASAVIIQHGINDIIHPVGTEVNPFRPWSDLPTADELIDGLRYYIEIARKSGLKVYLGTLLPIEGWRTYADFREELKNKVNDWIRTTKEADGYIDFDLAVRGENNPKAFKESFDSGDHLHPSAEAYKAMARAALDCIVQNHL